MKKLKVTGGILVGFGTVLAGVATLAIFGVFPLSVDFFGFNIDTQGERLAWIASWAGVAVVGLFILYLDRTGRRGEPD
jgi:hypothetical protein